MQYIVLKPISPLEGAIIHPAEPTAAEPEPAPVLLDETFFSGETDEERAANIERLIAQGVIAPALAEQEVHTELRTDPGDGVEKTPVEAPADGSVSELLAAEPAPAVPPEPATAPEQSVAEASQVVRRPARQPQE